MPFVLWSQTFNEAPIRVKIKDGQFEPALNLLLSIDTSTISKEGKDQFMLLLGDIYLQLGQNDLALKTLKSMEARLKDKSSLLAANCFEDLGITFWNNGNKSLALSYHERSLNIRQSLLENNALEIADSYNNIGLIYLESEFLQAIIYFNRALKIYKAKEGPKSAKVALVYSNLAFANSAQGNYADAIRYLDEVNEIWNGLYSGEHPNKAYTLSNKGLIYYAQQDYLSAEKLQNQALDMYENLYGSTHPEIANTYFLLGDVAMKESDFKKAVHYYQKSIFANLPDQEFQSVYDHPTLAGFLNADVLLSSLQAKAKALEALHFEKSLKPRDLFVALESYNIADRLVSKIRQLRQNESDKLHLSQVANQLYENAISLSLILAENTINSQKYLSEAFRYCERSKSAILLEAIAETHAKQFAGIPDEVIFLEDSFKTKINYFELKLAEGKGDIVKYKNELFTYEREYRKLIERIEGEFPKYFDLKFNTSLAAEKDIKEKLKSNEALLSYFVGENKIFIFIIADHKLSVITKPKPDNFYSIVKSYRNAIKYRIKKVYDQQAMELYELLIPHNIKNITRLQIIPAGILSTIPFEALKKSVESEPLIMSKSIAYDYSSTLWYNRRNTKNLTGGGILLNAPITFENNDSRMVDLPGTEKEIKEIKYLFIGTTTRPTALLEKNASENALKNTNLSDFKYLHFATHGVVNESKPELSKIFLSPDNQEDGSLFSGEIYNLNMDVSLVTLSACETGLGKLEKGEGVMGLSRALMYAGAQNLIVSLWKVSDLSTADLMISFYGDLVYQTDNLTFANSLRKAKISLIKSEKYHEPYFWAPFILVGQ